MMERLAYVLVAVGLCIAALGAAAKPRDPAAIAETAAPTAGATAAATAATAAATAATAAATAATTAGSGGAMTSVSGPAPRPSARLPLHVPTFATGFGVLVAGVILRAVARRRRRTSSEKAAGPASRGPGPALEAMRKLCDGASALRASFETTPAQAFLDRVDALTLEHVLVIGESRVQIAERLGPVAFAEMMVDYAVGERYLNRAWTAVADGYLEEARRALDLSVPALERAVESFEKRMLSSPVRNLNV